NNSIVDAASINTLRFKNKIMVTINKVVNMIAIWGVLNLLFTFEKNLGII
ncbi:unnamed protein product, partial [marine sediment metagenome]